MNIADDPNRVSVGQEWREGDYIGRVPIIVTGNDFTRMFAPLIRDGRMAKFYWKPTREDLVNILWQMYQVQSRAPWFRARSAHFHIFFLESSFLFFFFGTQPENNVQEKSLSYVQEKSLSYVQEKALSYLQEKSLSYV